jgi:hypothetical protein
MNTRLIVAGILCVTTGVAFQISSASADTRTTPLSGKLAVSQSAVPKTQNLQKPVKQSVKTIQQKSSSQKATVKKSVKKPVIKKTTPVKNTIPKAKTLTPTRQK